MCINERKYLQSITNIEKANMAKGAKEHAREVQLLVQSLNVFVSGFNNLPAFEINDENQAEYVWLCTSIRCFHSLRCALDLTLKGYYSQSLTLARTIIEDWFVSEAAKENEALQEWLINGQGSEPNYYALAKHPSRKNVYAQDYRFSSSFAHSSKRSFAVLHDPHTLQMVVAPAENDVLFMACIELLARSSLLMIERLLHLLTYANGTEKALDWAKENNPAVTALSDWLQELPKRYG